ncbi:sugar ABC transporter permease [Vibrio sp. JC009]|uniref:carbohydrate ABC transporter permease n=1 Tax=Vibrio sp. JC009 TaxID=2912314 RepID=UPI0023B072F6|nr:sugar ABC transporter permease [Vibrio sp. JC009]WED24630.1 sugar ABC transporter permease [Vibrio sp. JC009]
MASHERKYAIAMGSPALAGLSLFLLLPFLMAIALSFTNSRLLSPNPTELVGLENYRELLSVSYVVISPELDKEGKVRVNRKGEIKYPRLRRYLKKHHPELKNYYELNSYIYSDNNKVILLARDPVFWKSLYNTSVFVFGVLPLQCGLALGLALLVNRKLRGSNFFRTLYFAPVVTSMVVVAVIWSFLYHKEYGLVNQYISTLTFGMVSEIDWLGNPDIALSAIIIMSAWQGAGVQMLIFLAGLQQIPKERYEAASIDGANTWQKFRYITLPGLRNTIIFVLISTTIAAFGLFTQVDVMTGGGPLDSTSTVMFHAVRKGFREQDIAYGSAITVIYFVIILGIVLAQKFYFARRDN